MYFVNDVNRTTPVIARWPIRMRGTARHTTTTTMPFFDDCVLLGAAIPIDLLPTRQMVAGSSPLQRVFSSRGRKYARITTRNFVLLLLLVLSGILAVCVFYIRFPSETSSMNTLNYTKKTQIGSHKKNTAASIKPRLDWTNISLTSPMAKRIEAHMTNCSLPLGMFSPRNRMGLGSDLHVWSQVLCNSMEENVRIWSLLPWQWRDEHACASSTGSSLGCYFPTAELLCNNDGEVSDALYEISSPYDVKCPSILSTDQQVADFRAAAMEYLFRSVSPVVIQEAERQLHLVFQGGGVPSDLITVQIRWGDKQKEMKLLPAHDYIKGVQQILASRDKYPSSPVSVYLATEDPKAVEAFRQAAPKEWVVYVDQYYHDMLSLRNKDDVYNQGPKTARATKGRAGLVALGSLLVALEANDFVLTTASNWSRLMNELRKNVLDPRCNGCTNIVDLKYGEW